MLDASYLTMEHYSNEIPPCSTSIWVDCGKVLRSSYSMVGPVPLAVLGLMFYGSMVGLALIRIAVEKRQTWVDEVWRLVEKALSIKGVTFEQLLWYGQLLATVCALLFSAYFVYLQLIVIESICLYCMFSAMNSLILFGLTVVEGKQEGSLEKLMQRLMTEKAKKK